MKKRESFHIFEYLVFGAITVAVFLLCLCIGSVNIPVRETMRVIGATISGSTVPAGISAPIIVAVRLPRVICAALSGAALALCGAAMQGLLRNPLADGSTLGVSTGAALGATLAIAFNIRIPFIPGGGTMVVAIAFAFLTLILILSLTYKLDYSLSTNTIILIGVIFSMFAGSMISLVTSFAGDKVNSIVFWTMGSLSGSSYISAAILAVTLLICSAVLFRYCRELNAFAIGEDNARHVGIDIKKVKLTVLITVSVLIGVCVSIGGSIGFAGLVIPHMTRMITGPNHKRLVPASVFSGAVFLMLADLVSRVVLRPLELPIGVVTSIIGSIMFIFIFYSTRKVR